MPPTSALTSDQLATVLGVSARTIRVWARAGRIPGRKDGSRYVFVEDDVRDALASPVRPAIAPEPDAGVQPVQSRRAAYVLDLCDEILGTRGSREHTFSWLLGDPNAQGNRARLRVDSYWPDEHLIVEVHESQHHEPAPFFDRRQTLSGVGRAEQRRIYDARRAEQIPLHGLRLVVLRFADLSIGAKGQRKPDRAADLTTIRENLEPLARRRGDDAEFNVAAPGVA